MSRSRALATVVAGLIAAAVVLAVGAAGGLQRLEDESIDARFALRGTQPVSGLAIVAIDERTLSQGDGRWPLPRRRHAAMLDRLRALGVAQVVYDVQFTEPSGSPAQDLALYDAVARTGDVVLATAESDGGRTRVLGGEGMLRRANGAVAAMSTFPSDDQGAIRRYEPSVAGLDTLATRTAAKLGRPVDRSRFDDGTALIDFRGPPGTIPTFSFSDVLAGRVPAAALRGRTVVVGATATVLQDVHPTPLSGDRLMPGPELQATAIWTALHDNPLQPAGWWSEAPLALLLALLAVAAVARFGPLRGSVVAIGLGLAFGTAAAFAFDAGLVLPVAVPLGALLAATAAAAAVATAAVIADRRRVSHHNDELEAAVQERTAELARTQFEVVERLARAGELRDDDTGEHVDRMSRTCGLIALELGLDADRAELVRRAAVLHDVGKIGVPDEILHKPGRLTEAEFALMRGHAEAGARILAGATSPVLVLAEQIARTHHERWDGTGYPAGLAGEDIPLEGRIAAVADVFDALTNARPYKPAWSPEDARAQLERDAGSHFDPAVVAAFCRVDDRRRQAAPRGVPLPA